MSGLSSGASVVAVGVDGDGTEGRRPAERHQGRLPSIEEDLDIFFCCCFYINIRDDTPKDYSLKL